MNTMLSPGPGRRLVMQVAASLEFLPAARRLREGLFERLRARSLPGELRLHGALRPKPCTPKFHEQGTAGRLTQAYKQARFPCPGSLIAGLGFLSQESASGSGQVSPMHSRHRTGMVTLLLALSHA